MRYLLLIAFMAIAVSCFMLMIVSTETAATADSAIQQEGAATCNVGIVGGQVEVACWFPGKRAVRFFRNHKPVRRGVKAVFCGLTRVC